MDATTERIPIVDLGGTRDDAGRRAAVAREIHRAACDTGFFYVANHGLDPALLEAAFAHARAYFALPEERKLAGLMARGQARGYEPLDYQTLDAKTGTDLKESFSLGGEVGPDHPRAGDDAPELAPNRWPADLPGFREALGAYHAAACDLGAHLIRLLALSLGEPEDAFDAAYRGSNQTLRLLHYPPRPAGASAEQLGCGAHTDWGGITILAQDDIGGLEVQDVGGRWLAAVPVPGTFVVNLGDLTMRWTNERYHSTPHRVFNPGAARDRYSMALFYSPDHRAQISCLPTCLPAGESPRYAPCTAGEHLAERRRTTYGVA